MRLRLPARQWWLSAALLFIGSVVANLRQVLRLAALVRDRLSPDSWRIYNRLSAFAAAPARFST